MTAARANEVYNYMSCQQYETNSTVKFHSQIDLGAFPGLRAGAAAFRDGFIQRIENRDPAEVLPQELPEPIRYESHRQFVKRRAQ
ncbi:MAG: hypothetical protein K0Q83_268 [Deltaproteobacteria bacterium]|jgi:hypothetical protein|nr:hypothetical protein [Deltaproteobacteria bacterium]